MDKLALKEYQKRWLAVAALEEAERREASFSLRWRQLNSIVRLAAALQLTVAADSKAKDEVRRRWNTLRAAHANRS